MSYTKLHDRAYESDLAMLLVERRLELRGTDFSSNLPHDFSQSDVASRIGVRPATVNLWESGVQFPGTWSQWERWCRAVKAGWIMPRIEI